MTTFKITVPYTYMVSGEYEHLVDEDQVLDHFEVDSLDKIDPAALEEYLREEADDQAGWEITDDQVCELVREQKGLETQPDDITIETEQEEAAE
jgi:hypothetical protein